MFAIKKGTYRAGIRVGTLIFKFVLPTKNRKFFILGVVQNLTEWLTWQCLQAPFLAPTYVTLGVVNIQRYVEGMQPTNREMAEVLTRKLSAEGEWMLAMGAGGHNLDAHNWRKTSRGYILFDYADTLGDSMPLFYFLARFKEELTALLCSKSLTAV